MCTYEFGMNFCCCCCCCFDVYSSIHLFIFFFSLLIYLSLQLHVYLSRTDPVCYSFRLIYMRVNIKYGKYCHVLALENVPFLIFKYFFGYFFLSSHPDSSYHSLLFSFLSICSFSSLNLLPPLIFRLFYLSLPMIFLLVLLLLLLFLNLHLVLI